MKLSIVAPLLALFCSLASAQVIPIDVEGKAYLIRSGEGAALVITDAAVQKISSRVILNSDSQVRCAKTYCVIGKIARDGSLSSLVKDSAGLNFLEFMRNKRENVPSQADFFTRLGGTSWAYPNQCEDQGGLTTIVVEGRPAELLYNFLQTPEKPGVALARTEKTIVNDLFKCEKLAEFVTEDLSANGVPRVPVSYHDYRCSFQVSPGGQLIKESDCRINGASISAGGGK